MKRETLDHIFNNMINGNFGDVVEVCKHLSGEDMAKLADYFVNDLNQTELYIKLTKLYFRRLIK